MPSLTYKDKQFYLNGAPFHIFSGAIHYFRVVPDYWADRLGKAKACGLNTIETYVPWNQHEPEPGVFKSDGILDLRKFISVATDLDLKVILRPGPYICSEWDFGGLPSWLLADPHMRVRSNYPGYKHAAKRYLDWVLGLVRDLQCCHGGPIIAVQVENEFGSYSDDVNHLHYIKDVIEGAGIEELLVTSDNPWGSNPSLFLPGVLPTANFQTVEEGKAVVDIIEKADPSLPLVAMEFWSGWFDHWGSEHHRRSVDILEQSLQFVLDRKGSVNFYMFHGGTNFGFMSGANLSDTYKPDVTSYDYDAPISEDGSLTQKYFKIHSMIKEFVAKTYGKDLPDVNTKSMSLSNNRISERMEISLQEVMPWSSMINHVTKVTSHFNPRPMEMVMFGEGGESESESRKQRRQAYGYVVYRKNITVSSLLSAGGGSSSAQLILPTYMKDRATVLLDGKTVAVFDWKSENFSVELDLNPKQHVVTGGSGGSADCVVLLDVVVENLGRVNYTEKANPQVLNEQRKGLEGEVTLGGNPVNEWTIIALDFTDDFLCDVTTSDAWKEIGVEVEEPSCTTDSFDQSQQQRDADGASNSNNRNIRSSPTPTFGNSRPALYRSRFEIIGQPRDCFVKLGGFTKGVVLVNGFNLGRYWNIGPQKTLYLPAPILKAGGQNEVLVFEEQKGSSQISLETEPQLM